MKKLKLFSVLMLMVLLGIGNVWADNAKVDDVLWSEDFSSFLNGSALTENPTEGSNVFGGGTVSYAYTGTSKLYKGTMSAGGVEPELLIQKGSKTWTVSGIPTGGAVEMKLTFKTNQASKMSISISETTKLQISGSNTEYIISVKENQTTPETFNITFTNTNASTSSGKNARVDDVSLVVKTAAPSTDPSVTLDPTSINFGNVALGASVATREITVLGENLTSALTATSSNTDVFTVAVKAGDSLTPDGDGNVLASLVVTPITTAYGDFDETITINGGGLGADTAVVAVSMRVGGIVTVSPASPNLAFGEIPQNADAENYAKIITVSATNLTAYKEIRVQAPLYFQASPINISADENGVIEETEVKLMPVTTYDAGNYGDEDAKFEIVCTSPREFAGIEIGAPTMTIVSCSPLDAPTLGTLSKSYDYANITWTAVEHTTEYIFTLTEHNGESRTPLHTPNLGTEMLNLKANTQYDYTVQAVGDGTTYCESNPLLEGSFTTEDYPAATLTLSENGATRTWGLGLKLTSEIALPTAVAAGNEVDGKVLVGWSADADRATAPELAKGANYTMNATDVTLYAVYATETPGTIKGTKTDNIDCDFTGSPTSYTSWSGKTGTSGAVYAGNSTGGNDDRIQMRNSQNSGIIVTGPGAGQVTSVTIDWNSSTAASRSVKIFGKNTAYTATSQLYDENAKGTEIGEIENGDGDPLSVTDSYDYIGILAVGGAVYLNSIAIVWTEYNDPTYSGYTTSGAKAPSATVDPVEVEISAEALVGGLIDVTYENVNQANVTVALFNDAECTEAFDGGWLTASLDANKDIVYGAEAAVSYVNDRAAYIKLTAPATEAGPDPAVVIIPVTQAKKDAVFASFEELVAVGFESNVQVTVSFSSVQIVSFAASNKNVEINKKGDINNANIHLYNSSSAKPEGWQENGYISGTVSGTWGSYSNARQLTISTWDGINYSDTPTDIETVETSEKAVKLLRNGILLIEKNGHTYNAQGLLIK